MELRGFDSYTVTLGDELRGERACRGWTIRDAARELCIKPEMIEAIEDADLSAFPNRSVVPGYVRSYARYLGYDGDAFFRRFCEESGFESTLVTFGMTEAAAAGRADDRAAAVTGAVGADFTASRFAVRPAPRRIGTSVPLGGIVSMASLAGLAGALFYGGYAVLQDIQRVGFAPLPDAPAVVADAPEIAAPVTEVVARPDASAYSAGGALFGLSSGDIVAVARRDGPISAINPEQAGLVIEPALTRTPSAEARRVTPVRAASRGATTPVGLLGEHVSVPLAMATASRTAGNVDGVSARTEETNRGVALDAKPPARRVVVMDRAWLRISDRTGNDIFEGILDAGDAFDIPESLTDPVLRAGNAGGVFVIVGQTRYGPLGASGEVVKDVSLSIEAVTSRYAPAVETSREELLTSASR